MKTFNLKELSVPQVHGIILSAVAPRPIAFASTVDLEGKVNLSPFSFFNAFSANPPILVFSPSRRGRDNTTKHTLDNILEVPEVCINTVDHKMVEQMSLASAEYDRGINEFVKAGLTERISDFIKPPRVAESPVSFECRVNEVKALGDQGGAGNLVICEILLVHVNDEVLTDSLDKIDDEKLDLVARMGGNWYSRVNKRTMFEIPKPISSIGIGFDQLPEHVINSKVLSGNDLGRLATIGALPDDEEVLKYADHQDLMDVRGNGDIAPLKQKYQELAKEYISKGRVEDAWKVLLQPAHFED